MDRETMLRIIQSYVSKMPPLPVTVSKVLEICNNPKTSPVDLNQVISLDPVLIVPGVKTVINKLDVERGLAQALTKKQDEIITMLVKERFAKSATLKSAHFDVKTDEGIVSLSGAVRFQVIALEAAETARQVPGVRAVKTEKIRLEGEG